MFLKFSNLPTLLNLSNFLLLLLLLLFLLALSSLISLNSLNSLTSHFSPFTFHLSPFTFHLCSLLFALCSLLFALSPLLFALFFLEKPSQSCLWAGCAQNQRVTQKNYCLKCLIIRKLSILLFSNNSYRQSMRTANYKYINNLFGEVQKFTPPLLSVL